VRECSRQREGVEFHIGVVVIGKISTG
jgi:hypothetical protein